MTDALEALARLVEDAREVVALTGAGLSTESGLPDYRGAAGLWRERRFEELASVAAWHARPDELWAFYGERLRALRDAEPNAGHHALARLERAGRVHVVVTQNVDGLHRAAGSVAVLEVHGTLAEVECLACRWRGDAALAERDLDAGVAVPPCPSCGRALKPAVVLFGEQLPPAFAAAVDAVSRCDLLLCLGSSLQVHPVAELPFLARRAGTSIAIVNAGPTACDDLADVRVEGRTGEVLPALATRVGA